MRCKDIERLIIDSSERELSRQERLAIKEHTAQCSACTRFQDDWERIRRYLKKMPTPVLPSDLDEQTRLMCRTEKESLWSANKQPLLQTRSSVAVPKLILAALIFLTVLTVIIVVPQLEELKLDEIMPFSTVIALTIILQNAVMLFFTPILIRMYRSKTRVLDLFR